MSSAETNEVKPKKSQNSGRRPPPPTIDPPEFNHFTTLSKEMNDNISDAPSVQLRNESFRGAEEQQSDSSFRHSIQDQRNSNDYIGHNRYPGRPADCARGQTSDQSYYPYAARPYEQRPYEAPDYGPTSDSNTSRIVSSSSEFPNSKEYYNRDPSQRHPDDAWGGGHLLHQRVSQRHHPQGVYNRDVHRRPPTNYPYTNQGYPQSYAGRPQYYQSQRGGPRRQPPQNPPPGAQFQPYVDSDFLEGNLNREKRTPDAPYMDSNFKEGNLNREKRTPDAPYMGVSCEDKLGENKPSKVSVSVTSLAQSSYTASAHTVSDEEDLGNNGDNDSSSDEGSHDNDNHPHMEYPDIKAYAVKPVLKKLEHLEGKENNQTINSRNTLSPSTEKQLQDMQSPKAAFTEKKVALVAPKKASKSSGDSRVQKKPKMMVSTPYASYSKCLIMRDRKGMKNRLNPTYNLYSQDVAPGAHPELIMIAQKQTGRTSNYRFFDMRHSKPNKKLGKNSPNYVGKLRGNFNRDEYTAYGVNKEVKGAVVFDKADVLSQMIDGALPRKMGVLLPLEVIEKLNNLQTGDDSKIRSSVSTFSESCRENDEETKSDEDDDASSLESTSESKPFRDMSPEERLAVMMDRVVDQDKEENKNTISSIDVNSLSAASQPNIVKGKVGSAKSRSYLQLTSKEPVFEKNSYRLNFRGRVKLPSVKNYQLVQPTDIDNVWTQFGKVTEDKFHLDYKEPLDTFLAFAVAISQFDY